jgi:hypothetical protein
LCGCYVCVVGGCTVFFVVVEEVEKGEGKGEEGDVELGYED